MTGCEAYPQIISPIIAQCTRSLVGHSMLVAFMLMRLTLMQSSVHARVHPLQQCAVYQPVGRLVKATGVVVVNWVTGRLGVGHALTSTPLQDAYCEWTLLPELHWHCAKTVTRDYMTMLGICLFVAELLLNVVHLHAKHLKKDLNAHAPGCHCSLCLQHDH